MKKIFIILLLISYYTSTAQVDTNYVNSEVDKLIQSQKNSLEKVDDKLTEQSEKVNQNSQNYKELQLLLAQFQSNFDSLNSKYENLKFYNISLRATLDDTIKPFVENTNKNYSSQVLTIDELKLVDKTINSYITKLESELSSATTKGVENTNQITAVSVDLLSKQKSALILFSLVLLLILIFYIISNKKSKKIFENQIKDSQQIADWLNSQSESNLDNSSASEPNHSFAKKVADEIIRISTNLDRMDKEIRGYKQLNASVRKLKQALDRNEYEIVELLNTKYSPGMNVEANFILDETLSIGESKITRIIKPQINYKGKMIQMAQVEVSQND